MRDGMDGMDGMEGAPGKDGKDGRDGRDGRDGSPGRPGQPGARGKDAPVVTSAKFQHDNSQRISSVVEYLSDGNKRTFTVQRNAAGRPVELTLG